MQKAENFGSENSFPPPKLLTDLSSPKIRGKTGEGGKVPSSCFSSRGGYGCTQATFRHQQATSAIFSGFSLGGLHGMYL